MKQVVRPYREHVSHSRHAKVINVHLVDSFPPCFARSQPGFARTMRTHQVWGSLRLAPIKVGRGSELALGLWVHFMHFVLVHACSGELG